MTRTGLSPPNNQLFLREMGISMTSLDLYTWKTSNGRKATIMLEECGLEYNVHPIDISTDMQFSDEFVAINPNSKIPALVDHNGPNHYF